MDKVTEQAGEQGALFARVARAAAEIDAATALVLADGERLVEPAFAEPAKRPGGGDDDHPLDQNQCKLALDGDRIHKSPLADTNRRAAKQD